METGRQGGLEVRRDEGSVGPPLVVVVRRRRLRGATLPARGARAALLRAALLPLRRSFFFFLLVFSFFFWNVVAPALGLSRRRGGPLWIGSRPRRRHAAALVCVFEGRGARKRKTSKGARHGCVGPLQAPELPRGDGVPLLARGARRQRDVFWLQRKRRKRRRGVAVVVVVPLAALRRGAQHGLPRRRDADDRGADEEGQGQREGVEGVLREGPVLVASAFLGCRGGEEGGREEEEDKVDEENEMKNN